MRITDIGQQDVLQSTMRRKEQKNGEKEKLHPHNNHDHVPSPIVSYAAFLKIRLQVGIVCVQTLH